MNVSLVLSYRYLTARHALRAILVARLLFRVGAAVGLCGPSEAGWKSEATRVHESDPTSCRTCLFTRPSSH
ncbi:hypothetical protein BS17DRAFT_156413 [Gyrodon lividus]|nr:hypothetical protein BS17DRAFT_156413 [Gyrodon lividus]